MLPMIKNYGAAILMHSRFNGD